MYTNTNSLGGDAIWNSNKQSANKHSTRWNLGYAKCCGLNLNYYSKLYIINIGFYENILDSLFKFSLKGRNFS